jgi:hypothetical protein
MCGATIHYVGGRKNTVWAEQHTAWEAAKNCVGPIMQCVGGGINNVWAQKCTAPVAAKILCGRNNNTLRTQ